MNCIKIPITPMPKPRMTRADAWKKRPVVQKYWAYKDELCLWCNEKDLTLGKTLIVQFDLPMPKSWSKKKKAEMLGQTHEARPDTDNLMKALKDCLLTEDSQVHTELGRKRWSDHGAIRILELSHEESDGLSQDLDVLFEPCLQEESQSTKATCLNQTRRLQS